MPGYRKDGERCSLFGTTIRLARTKPKLASQPTGKAKSSAKSFKPVGILDENRLGCHPLWLNIVPKAQRKVETQLLPSLRTALSANKQCKDTAACSTIDLLILGMNVYKNLKSVSGISAKKAMINEFGGVVS